MAQICFILFAEVHFQQVSRFIFQSERVKPDLLLAGSCYIQTAYQETVREIKSKAINISL